MLEFRLFIVLEYEHQLKKRKVRNDPAEPGMVKLVENIIAKWTKNRCIRNSSTMALRCTEATNLNEQDTS